MSENVQIVMYVVVALIVIAAILWGGKRLKLKVPGVEIGVDPQEQQRKTSVANDVIIESATVGNVTGERRTNASGTAAGQVDVMNRAVIRGGSVGDITGIEDSGGPGAEKK